MINIITSFYISKINNIIHNDRSEEIFNCLKNNLTNKNVKKIHLFLDDNDAYEKIKSLYLNDYYYKINIIDIVKKPKHIDFFEYAKNSLKGEICMVTNSDIFINEINEEILMKVTNNRIAYALTRYEHDMSFPQIMNYLGSHDAYIFEPSFLNESMNIIDFYPNVPGIETHIIKMFIDNNYKVFNPCYQIKIIHLHASNLRNYSDNWIGLHRNGDKEQFFNSEWCIKPCIMDI
jgi:hypothetical protein